MGRLPKESKGQEIGHRASFALYAAVPLAWRLHSLEGTDDAGFDFQVQLTGDRQYRNAFRLQLKGTESPQLNVSKDYFLITFKVSTFKYYERITEPVLIVLADLSVDAEPSKCPSYYVWAHDEILRLKSAGSLTGDSDSCSVRIPCVNVLTRDLNVADTLESHMHLHMSANDFDIAMASAIPEYEADQRAQVLNKLAEQLPKRGRGFIESVSTPGETPWAQSPRESFGGRLHIIDQRLRHGDTAESDVLLKDLLPDLPGAASMERAEYWYLTGRCQSLQGDEGGAARSYRQAHSEDSQTVKYLTAHVEMELRIRYKEGQPCEISDLVNKLSSNEPAVVGLLARLLAASGKYDEANSKLALLEPHEAVNEKAIVASMQDDSNSVITICSEGLAKRYQNDTSKQLLHMLRARAYFRQALGLKKEDVDYVMPVFGPPTIDFQKLELAWQDIQTAVNLMRLAGWPSNVEHISDIWGGVAVILGRQDAVLPDILDAARRRPFLVGLQQCLERVAVTCGKIDLALEAIGRQPDGPEKVFRKIVSLHQAREYRTCVDLMQEELNNLPRDHPMFPICLGTALLAADQVVRPDAAAKFEGILKSNPAWAENWAIVDYLRAISTNVLAKGQAMEKLEQAHEHHKESIVIAAQLFHELDANDIDQARKCIAIAAALKARSQLDIESTLHLAQAYTTTSDWNLLLTLVNDAISRFGPSGRLVAIRAFALDKSGRTSEAVEELRSLVRSGSRDPLAINTYINIVTRCGFTAEATELVETLIGHESDRRIKLQYLQLLFGLVHRDNPHGSRAEGIAWQFGQLVKSDDESEEGIFLALYLTATLSEEVRVTDDRKHQFQKRLVDFTAKFPESKILRSAALPESPTVRDLEKMLDEVTGQNQYSRALQQKMVSELERGQALIPFAWRPRRILVNVSDIAQLWEIAKVSKRDARQYHLTMALNEWKAISPRQLGQATPILDLTTLFVIKDLNLFAILFALFPRIAISQETILELQRLAQPMGGSWAQSQCLQLISVLQDNFHKIIQPTVSNLVRSKINNLRSSEEVKALALGGDYLLYSDDLIFRVYVDLPKEKAICICTLDLLHLAETRGLLTLRESAEKISKLVQWNVVVSVSNHYLTASIPLTISMAPSISEAVSILQGDSVANPLFEGVWNIRKNYEQLVIDAANIISYLIQEPRNDPKVIAAVWALWYIKVKLRGDTKVTPPLRHAVLAMLKATTFVPKSNESASKLLWSAFLTLLPIEFADRMDEKKERDSVELVGAMAAEIELSAPRGEQPVKFKDWLLLGLTEGTADYDRFAKAHFDASMKLLTNSEKNKK
jgi:tetratricopeptide (TPR) repeat protein